MIAELEKILPMWRQISEILTVPHSSEQYDKLVTVMDSLVDEIGDDENHPLANLLETVGNLLHGYENDRVSIADAAPHEVLKELMVQHGLSQTDLTEIGSQGVVSEILRGKRALNVRQIKLLGERFKVSPAAFV